MLNEKFSILLCNVMSKKLVLLSKSFSMENVIVGIALLKKCRSLSTSVLESLYTIRISSTYQKQPRMLFCNSIVHNFVLSMNCKYISERSEDVGAPIARRAFCI